MSGTIGSACDNASDCLAGLVCRDSLCARGDGVDGGMDTGGGEDTEPDTAVMCPPSRMCAGDVCCPAGQTCGGGELCCAPADLCGGVCCGDGMSCEADRCVVNCEEDETSCGSPDAMICCSSGDLCYLGECTTPGAACESNFDCPEGEYCESTAMRCLPRFEGGEECEYRPDFEDFEIAEEWHWSGDTDVMPAHNQVMMAPVVANLTDDNGDGLVNEDDTPDVVFHTFTGSNYWGDGILRAVSGDDGSRIWPLADPGYRTAPGGEVAIAELDASSPGPELVVCAESNRTTRPLAYMMLISAQGELIRRFDTAPNDVPCIYDAPAVADMDGDGTPEIVVGWVIAHADGTVVRRIRDARGSGRPFNTLANVDDDPDLELVSGNGAYNMDGTAVWEDLTLPAGQIAIGDLDLDGTPEIVNISGGDHAIRSIDALTGTLEWGPIDINPPELAGEIAAGGRGPNGGGAPTIANFDEDANPEIAFAGGYAYVVFEHDGSRKWYDVTQDRSSRVTGSSIFDFEGDGVAEVLYNDERRFRVYRGTDGEVLYEQCNSSGTLREHPIVVDVDNDDHAEIILMENNYAFGGLCDDGVTPATTGIHVFGHPTDQWVRTRRIWNQHTYHVTNINEDATVPTREEPNWSTPRLNNFRQNVQPDGLFNAPDLALRDLIGSSRTCPTALTVSVRVVNIGSAGARAGVPVTFYETSRVTPMMFARAVTSRPLLPGESELLSVEFLIPDGGDATTFSFAAIVNDPADMPIEGLNECDETNNDVDGAEARCNAVE